MGCLDVKIASQHECIVVSVSRKGEDFEAMVSLANLPIDLSVHDTSKHLTVKCNLVCTVEEVETYLRVSPKEIQWITDGMGIVYKVESNTNWVIVIS